MSRPKKRNVEYFPHACIHGKKMSYIEKKYGNDGYAVWFKLLEELGNADDHWLDLKDEVQLMFLTDRLGVDEELLLSIINDLIKLGQFDKDLWQGYQVLYNQKFVDSISDVYKKRIGTPIITKLRLNQHLLSLRSVKLVNDNENPVNVNIPSEEVVKNTQSKVKESKVKESKVNNTIPKKPKVFSEEIENLFLGVLRHFHEGLHPHTPSETRKWKETLRKLVELDNIPPNIILDLVEKARNDDFWSQNFLSIVKLRRKNPDNIKYIQVFYEKFKERSNKSAQTSDFRERLKRGLSGNINQ